MMIALLSTLSLAATLTPADQSAHDYADGYALGTAHAELVQVSEWALYGAAGSCIGPVGCVAVTVGAMQVDPAQIRPLRGAAPVPQVELDNLPPPPAYVVDSDSWAQGYEAGWDQRVQHRRTAWALAGGIALPVAAVTAYVGLASGIYWLETR